MTVALRFAIDIRPQPKQRTANIISAGRIKRYTPDETRNFEASVKQLAWLAMREQGIKKVTNTAVHLTLDFIFGVPVSLSKAARLVRLNAYHTMKPDLTNLCKAIEDGCNDMVYGDDSQIASITMTKRWGEKTLVNVLFQWTPNET